MTELRGTINRVKGVGPGLSLGELHKGLEKHLKDIHLF